MKKATFCIVAFLSLPVLAIDYDDFPLAFQQILDQRMAELDSEGGVCFAGRITTSDESPIRSGKDVKINFLQGVDIPLWVYNGGWFIMGRTFNARSITRPAKLVLRAFGYEPIDTTVVALEGEITYAEFEMKKTPAEDLATVTGIVTGDQSEPVAGAYVNLSFSFASHGINEEPYWSITTEPNGRYSFDGLSGAEHNLSVGASGYAYRSIRFKPDAGEVVTKNIELYPNIGIVIDYVYQADGSRNFAGGDLQTGTIEWVNGSGGVDFSDGKVEEYERESLRDIEMRQIQDRLNFNLFYVNGQNGFYDAGDTDFESVKEAPESGYSTGTKACIVGHTYVVKTYEGNYAKFVVIDIFEE